MTSMRVQNSMRRRSVDFDVRNTPQGMCGIAVGVYPQKWFETSVMILGSVRESGIKLL